MSTTESTPSAQSPSAQTATGTVAGESTPTGRTRTVLVIDTATDTVVTGIGRITTTAGAPECHVVAVRAVADGRRHAEILTSLIAEVLEESGVGRDGIDAVVVGTGPGPFTGLRVGMATGAGFGDALDIPVFGVCSLDAIAHDVGRVSAPGATVLALTDARRREVYWALYRDGGHTRTRGPEVSAPGVVAEILSDSGVDAVGGSATHLRQSGWGGDDPAITVPSVAGLLGAAAIAVTGGQSPPPLLPLYLRRPDAVERKDQQPKKVGAS
ncbi:tRNA (adenosine(37)-N6)-threonylcarbamoyltransferase complex dimerization subunit type 1 TsaB [Gordonia polyisoprenivorans]|uniref:tRNA (adenosine(37)-N6)-threonylcarbamoyltransferase complex dimerization subunit type 1 TsaB n=1 Tax=Gordonia polyisoprenivorans TaxID=84595 RepID=UPI0023014CB2|nr:tRNA (adenosine(37)-N6)-threonylcarbamoyltransferase complex dimerization subunit type 1 TsaB [Gordonia polyisoprenivorans]WCB39120.1 tRNA (adenosine(37)-N6)-threonylcarbamoyltransferase complex dimerization subunit type 1 TsaB [Gordonia polyisoprenivorans]